MEKTKIIIDTDIGDDIDDALALALALECPELEILGITTVYKNTLLRTKMVKALLSAYNRQDIPVIMGCGTPFVKRVDTEEIPHQYKAINEDFPVDSTITAAEFIIKTLKEHPETVIVPIGAQTNIALAFMLAPEVMKKAKILCMGGVFNTTFPEWNIDCDPEAAKLLCDFAIDLTYVGLDVTTKVFLSKAHIENIRQNTRPQVRFLHSLMQKWFDSGAGGVLLHDPLTIAYLVSPQLLEMQPANVYIELTGQKTRGVTFDAKNPFTGGSEIANRHNIAVNVNADSFINLFMSRVFY